MKKPAKKPSSKQQQIIVLVDNAGNHYELSRATLERCRVDDRRKKKVEESLQDKPEEFRYIGAVNIPGSIAAGPFKGGRALHYAGFYLSSTKSKR